jgi:hypothetical protein
VGGAAAAKSGAPGAAIQGAEEMSLPADIGIGLKSLVESGKFTPPAPAQHGALLNTDTVLQAHAKEMVLPPSISTGLQNVIGAGGFNPPPALTGAGRGGAPGAPGGPGGAASISTGDTNVTNNHFGVMRFNYSPSISGSMDPAEHGEAMFKFMRQKLQRMGLKI